MVYTPLHQRPRIIFVDSLESKFRQVISIARSPDRSVSNLFDLIERGCLEAYQFFSRLVVREDLVVYLAPLVGDFTEQEGYFRAHYRVEIKNVRR